MSVTALPATATLLTARPEPATVTAKSPAAGHGVVAQRLVPGEDQLGPVHHRAVERGVDAVDLAVGEGALRLDAGLVERVSSSYYWHFA